MADEMGMSIGNKILFVRPFISVLILMFPVLFNFEILGAYGFIFVLLFAFILMLALINFRVGAVFYQKEYEEEAILRHPDDGSLSYRDLLWNLKYMSNAVVMAICRHIPFLTGFALALVLVYVSTDSALYLLTISGCLMLVGDLYFSLKFSERKFPLTLFPFVRQGKFKGYRLANIPIFLDDFFLSFFVCLIMLIMWYTLNLSADINFKLSVERYSIWIGVYAFVIFFSGYFAIGSSVYAQFLTRNMKGRGDG